MTPVNPYDLLHRPPIREIGLQISSAESAHFGLSPGFCQLALMKTYRAQSAVTGTQALAMSRNSKGILEAYMKVYIGIDWSEKKHDICFMNDKGEVMLEKQIEHNLSGFIVFDQARRSLNIEVQDCYIGLETAHNALVDYLWEQGYTQITVLPPRAVKSAQGRFRQSGAKDDRWDAHLIADILRTDRHRFSMWKPDLALTRQIRAEVSFVGQLTKEQIRIGNRLRAALLRYYPGLVETFGTMEGLVFLAFVQVYPTIAEAHALDLKNSKPFCVPTTTRSSELGRSSMPVYTKIGPARIQPWKPPMPHWPFPRPKSWNKLSDLARQP